MGLKRFKIEEARKTNSSELKYRLCPLFVLSDIVNRIGGRADLLRARQILYERQRIMIRDKAIELYTNNVEANDLWRVTQSEVDRLNEEIVTFLLNTRATTADMQGIEIFERVYNIIPNLTEAIEERRGRVLERLRARAPFTLNWLRHELKVRTGGEDSIRVEMDGLVMNLVIDIPVEIESEAFMSRRVIRELIPWLRAIIPANILLLYISQIAIIELHNYNDIDFNNIKLSPYSYINRTYRHHAPSYFDTGIHFDSGARFDGEHSNGVAFNDVTLKGYAIENKNDINVNKLLMSKFELKGISKSFGMNITSPPVFDRGYHFDYGYHFK